MGDSSLALGMTDWREVRTYESAPSATCLFLVVAVFGQGELALRRSGFALRRCLFGGWRRGQPHSDQFAHAALFHGHAVKHISLRDRALVVGDDNELALRNETVEHADEAIDVAFIQWRVDFVEHAKRAGAVHVDCEEKRDRGHGALATAQ